jgi:hypothetical protein
MNLNGFGRKISYLRYYPGHFHGQTEKTTKKPVMRASVLVIITPSNQPPLEYSSRAISLHQPLLGAFFILYMMDPASEASAVLIKRLRQTLPHALHIMKRHFLV